MNRMADSRHPEELARKRMRRWIAGMFSMSWLAVAGAQQVSDADAARVRAAIVIDTFDELDARCSRAGGFSAAQRGEADQWVAGQGVEKLRAHLNGAGLSATLREQARAASAQVIQQVAAAANPCVAAVSITRTNDAKFADKLPLLLAGSTDERAFTGPPQTQPSPKPKAPAGPAPAIATGSGNAARLAADIEGFGFDSCTRIGYGGMVMYVPCPVVLFKNGGALTDVEGLNYPQGIAAHRSAKPGSWTQW